MVRRRVSRSSNRRLENTATGLPLSLAMGYFALLGFDSVAYVFLEQHANAGAPHSLPQSPGGGGGMAALRKDQEL